VRHATLERLSLLLLLNAAVAGAAGQSPSDTVTLSGSQLGAIAVARIAEREFVVESQAVGNVDFDENLSAQVFSPYQGRIIRAAVDLGDDVRKDQILFTVESPDFIAAQANLIAAAAVLDQTSSALTRARVLYASKGIDQNDYETAVANQQSADGALEAARSALAVFGRTEAQIDAVVETRKVERALIVRSPIAGRITARNAAPGTTVQPGVAPAPYTVADLSIVWLLANVAEMDAADVKLGQAVAAQVLALPGRVFAGKVSAMSAGVDPNSHRLAVRIEIKDPGHERRPQRAALFSFRPGAPVHAPGVPADGVVREGDGTMSVWVTEGDPHRFTRRIVKVGLQQDGYDQILEGLRPGETVAVSGAIFLSNILYGGAT
jgi:cobalt-zinc-cadmium efflux system membrane fusion protein